MKSGKSFTQNILETGTATVTSGGHWFNATRETVEQFIPGLLKKQDYEKLVRDAVTWIESTDSLSLVLYFILVFTINTTVATLATLLFFIVWFFKKSAVVNLPATPVLRLLNHDAFQLGLAAVALSFLGIEGMYAGLVVGIVFFFLFKVGLLRMGIDRVLSKKEQKGIPLNDRVFKMVLIRYSIYEDLSPPEVKKLEEHIKKTILEHKMK